MSSSSPALSSRTLSSYGDSSYNSQAWYMVIHLNSASSSSSFQYGQLLRPRFLKMQRLEILFNMTARRVCSNSRHALLLLPSWEKRMRKREKEARVGVFASSRQRKEKVTGE